MTNLKEVAVQKKDLTAVVVPNGKIVIRFTGLWTRADINRAFISALRELPSHIAKEKIKLEGAKK